MLFFKILLLYFSMKVLQWTVRKRGDACMAAHANLLDKNIKKNMIQMALPLMFLNLINSLYSVVDTFFVGRIGELQVGAVTLVGPITSCAVAFTTGLNAAALALISQSIGAGNREKANKTATHLVLLSSLTAIIMNAALLFFTDPILAWLDCPADILKDSRAYLQGIAFDFIGMFLLSLFLSPIFLAIPSYATAPALIIVGFLMMQQVGKIVWEGDLLEAIPAYICIAVMPFAYSISDGIAFGVISYTVFHLLAGKGKKVTPLMYVLAVLFVLKYVFL